MNSLVKNVSFLHTKTSFSFWLKIPLMLLTLISLTSCFWNKELEIEDLTSIETLDQETNYINKDYTYKLLTEGDYKTLINYYEEIKIEELLNKLNEEEKLTLANAYLSYGNAYYTEENYAIKALEILNTLEPSFSVLYLKGYANEIQKNYEEARRYYIEAKGLPDITLEQQATILNQIGHTYDLEGDYMTANEYYVESENTGIILNGVLLNRGRYEYRNGNYETAEKYFKQALEREEETDTFIKSEIYFDLSSIYLSKQDEESHKQGLEYANQGIQIQPDYPYNYTNLGIGYYLLNELDKVEAPLKKALELYPYSVQTTKYLGIYYYTIDDFPKAIENFKLESENADRDITIMQDQREQFKKQALYDIARSYALDGKIESINYLNELIGNGEDEGYYMSFILDLTFGGVYDNILETEEFKEALQRYTTLYSSKEAE